MTHVRVTREQASRLVESMDENNVELVELTNGNDGRLTASAIETIEKRKRLAISKPGSMQRALERALDPSAR